VVRCPPERLLGLERQQARSRNSSLDAVGALSEFPLGTHALVSGRRPRERGRCGARAWSILDGLISTRRRPVAVRLASPGQRLEWGVYLCKESAEEQGDEGERRAQSCRFVQTAVPRLQCPECGCWLVPRLRCPDSGLRCGVDFIQGWDLSIMQHGFSKASFGRDRHHRRVEWSGYGA
jgi:hypothetical protein